METYLKMRRRQRITMLAARIEQLKLYGSKHLVRDLKGLRDIPGGPLTDEEIQGLVTPLTMLVNT